jgi:two-component system nitrate/nitrite response regulator NarL
VRVLLCDDHTLFAEAVGAVLARRGDDVRVASRPHEAVEQVTDRPPDVCVMDLRFAPDGEVEGLDAAAAVMAVSPRTRVLVLTGCATSELVRRGVALGVRGFVQKGEALSVVIAAVDAVADGAMLVPPHLLYDRPPSTAGERDRFEELTPRERAVLGALMTGGSTAVIADMLEMSYATARTHTQNLYNKLGVHSRLSAVAYAHLHGFTGPGRMPPTAGPREAED